MQAFADGFRRFYSRAGVLLDGDGRAYRIGPAGVFKGDGLNGLYDLVRVDACGGADVAAFFHAADAVFFQHAEDFIYSSVVAFKQFHDEPSLFFSRIDVRSCFV